MQRHIALSILLILVLCPTVRVSAQSIALSNLVLDNQEGRIKVRFGADIKNLDAVKTALADGQSLLLDCRATLSLKREYTWNREVAKAGLKSVLTMPTEGGPCEIVLSTKPEERYRGRDAGLVIKEAWGDLSMDLGPWNLLNRGNDYALNLEIRLLRQNVPAWMKNTLFFWDFDAVPAGRYQLDFSY